MSILSQKVSFYKNVRDTTGTEVSISAIINSTKNGKYKAQIEAIRNTSDKKKRNKLKADLPAFTISGTFAPKKRKAEFIRNYTGLIQIDFDDLTNLKLVSRRLKTDPYTFAQFLSPSGTGIKLIVKVENDVSKHLESFKALESYYTRNYTITIDPSCKDVNRLFFVSSDSELFLNEESKVFDIVNKDKTKPKPVAKKKTAPKSTVSSSKVQGSVLTIQDEINIIAEKIIYSRTDVTQTYENWLNIGFSIASEFGEAGRDLYHNISAINSEYDFAKCDKQYTNCLKSNSTGITAKTFFKIAKDAGIDVTIKKKKSKPARQFKPTKKNDTEEKREIEFYEDFDFYDMKNQFENGFFELKEEFGYYAKSGKNEINITDFRCRTIFLFPDGSNNATRLMKIENEQDGETLIELYAKDITTLSSFKSAIKSKGNYNFFGSGGHLDRMFATLCRKEIKATKLSSLGYDKELNIYAFSNGILDEKQNFIETDDYGVIRRPDGQNIFLPYNSILNDEDNSFDTERNFKFTKGTITFERWAKLFITSFGKNGVFGAAYLVSVLFRDIVFDYKGHYPFTFLFGSAGGGKTTYTKCLLYPFVGNIERWSISAGSTEKAIGRKISVATNGLMYLKEFDKNTITSRTVDFLKSAYDGVGYDRALKTNDNRTSQTQVKNALMLDGNYLPTQQAALFDRTIVIYFDKSHFSEETATAIETLLEELKKGGGGIIQDILKHRENVQANFKGIFNQLVSLLKKKDENKLLTERTLSNLASIGAPIMCSNFLPKEMFLQTLVNELFALGIEQETSIKSIDEVNVFWKSIIWNAEQCFWNIDVLARQGVFLREKDFGLKLDAYYPAYIEYMDKNGNKNILDKISIKKHITNPSNKILLDTSKVMSVRAKNVRCMLFKRAILEQ